MRMGVFFRGVGDNPEHGDFLVPLIINSHDGIHLHPNPLRGDGLWVRPW